MEIGEGSVRVPRVLKEIVPGALGRNSKVRSVNDRSGVLVSSGGVGAQRCMVKEMEETFGEGGGKANTSGPGSTIKVRWDSIFGMYTYRHMN
ncbi:hypothetical protein L2E82_32555 [Cichorium intybus]|uniref:Uncharacterized protein n=1 Tax=Cichorium intybus TaxID=13427 RepID=A0ACB9BHW8_CICIN|nr:hypothetical protein L2E82_32555 [Cichorium intybus]